MGERPQVTKATHLLPFDKLSPLDFERMCLWLVRREGYERAEHLGASGGEQGRDVVAWRAGRRVVFQCKRVHRLSPGVAKKEIGSLRLLPAGEQPDDVVFVVSTSVSATTRDSARAAWGARGSCDFWAGSELDEKVKRHPQILHEFFDLGGPVLPPQSHSGGFQIPPLPPHFVPRSRAEADLKSRLLRERDPAAGTAYAVAVHGMGGVGKSTLAKAVAHDPEVREAFPDGILWAEIQVDSDVLSLLLGWVYELGEHDYHSTSRQAVAAHLCERLYDKVVLLVVDNLMDRDLVPFFQVAGSRCRTLVTTRSAEVAEDFGAEPLPLGVMTPSESLAALAARLRRDFEPGEESEASKLAEAVGFLPLALELAARRVARGTPWTALVAALDAEAARLEALEQPRQRRAGKTVLEASFNVSLDALRGEDESLWEAFCWLGAVGKGAVLAAPMAARLWGVDEGEAADRLEILWSDALLAEEPPVRIRGRSWPAYRIHNLLHDTALRLLTSKLGLRLEAVHGALLERYKPGDAEGRPQALSADALPVDGYIHDHLIWHLEKAGRPGDVHALLAETTVAGRNRWFEISERLGRTRGYLEDVARAGRLAALSSEAQLAAGEPAVSLGLEVRYALLAASVASLAAHVPPALVARLTESGHWDPVQALTYVAQTDWLGLSELAPHLPEAIRRDLLREALTSGDEEKGLWAVAALAPHSSDSSLTEVVAAVRSMSEGLPILVDLAPRLSDEENLRTLEQLDASQDEIPLVFGTHLRAELAPNLPEETQAAVLDLLLFSWDQDLARDWTAGLLAYSKTLMATPEYLQWTQAMMAQHSKVMTGLLNYTLDVDVSMMSLDEFRRWFLELKDGDWSIQPFALFQLAELLAPILARHLAGPLFEQLLERFPRWCAGPFELPEAELADLADAVFVQILDWIVPRLARPMGEEVLRKIERIRDVKLRLRALEAFLLPAEGPSKDSAQRSAVHLLGELETSKDLVAEIQRFAPHLSEDLLEKTLGRLEELDEDGAGLAADVARRILPELPAEWVPRALARVREVGSDWDQVAAYAAVLRRERPLDAEGEILEAALKIVATMGNAAERVKAFSELAPWLSEPQLEAALRDLRQVDSERSELLAGLVPHLPDRLLLQALETVSSLGDDDEKSEVLASVVPRLAEAGALEPARRAAGAIADPLLRATALVEVARSSSGAASEETLVQALATARSVETRFYRIRGEKPIESRVSALVGVAEHLAEPLREEVLKEALETATEAKEDTELSRLGKDLARLGCVDKALTAASSIKNPTLCARTLARISMLVPESRKSEIMEEALEAILAVSKDENRDELLANWASALQEYLPRKASSALAAIKDPQARVRAWIAVAPHLEKEERSETLAKAGRLALSLEAGERASALAALGEVLPAAEKGRVFSEALAEASRIDDEQERAAIIRLLAPRLDALSLRRARSFVVEMENPTWQGWALPALGLRFAELGALDEARATVLAALLPEGRAEGLVTLIHLGKASEEGLLRGALKAIGQSETGVHERQDKCYPPGGGFSVIETLRTWTLRSQLLAELSPYVSPSLRSELHSAWQQVLLEQAADGRCQLFFELKHLSTVVSVLGGGEALAQTAQGIVDAATWWP